MLSGGTHRVSICSSENHGRFLPVDRKSLAAFLVFLILPAEAFCADIATLSVTVRDPATGQPMPARCSVIDSSMNPRFPPPATCFYHTVDGGYFYSAGEFTVVVPTGPTIIRLGRGFEYVSRVETVIVSGDTSITFELERLYDMASDGWFCGDVHAHLAHNAGYYTMDPEDALLVASAEGLSVINCLDNDYHFTGGPDPCSTEECIVYMTEEKRSGVWGHYGLLGLQRLLEPFSDNWGRILADLADSVHAQDGAIVIAAHPVPSDDFSQIIDWPGSGIARELPADCAAGRVDAYEVMSYSNIIGSGLALGLWYDLLDCGLRLPACAGTDALLNELNQRPPGGYRTYVHIPGGELDYYAWLRNLAGGRTFVSNGPLFKDFRVLGFEAGDTLFVMKGSYRIPVAFSVISQWPLNRVEIVVNGEVEETVFAGDDPLRIEGIADIRVNGSCWIAARAWGQKTGWLPAGDFLFAHTSPFYLDMASASLASCASAEAMSSWLGGLLSLIADRDDWESPLDSLYAVGKISDGISWFGCPGGIPCGAEEAGAEDPSSRISIAVFPNPPGSEVWMEFDLSSGSSGSAIYSPAEGRPYREVEVSIFDVTGRLVRKVFSGSLPAAGNRVHWNGRTGSGREAASGIYFCRVRTDDGRSGSAKILIVR